MTESPKKLLKRLQADPDVNVELSLQQRRQRPVICDYTARARALPTGAGGARLGAGERLDLDEEFRRHEPIYSKQRLPPPDVAGMFDR
ncbi:MAG: hypothetical protein OEQ25_16870 [Gammaproteobacteria bacterium]|nr:hypothetical protein [Gammaproteobacteria bacterium]MDH3508812.1 hypothetical protein [Gammaproteobacteria bacterium]